MGKQKKLKPKQSSFKSDFFSKEQVWVKHADYWLPSLFFVLSLIGIFHHEMWRDEFQAWMAADDAHSLPQLFQNIKYEGHPALWHLILYIITACTRNYFWMQVVHILITTSSVFLLSRYSPFPLLQKILFVFGYFIFFEYNLISRDYALEIFFIMIFCTLYQQRKKQIYWMAFILFLFSNISVFGVLFTLLFVGIVFIDNLFYSDKEDPSRIPLKKMAIFLTIVAAGGLISYLQIRPEPDNTFQRIFFSDFEWNHVKRMCSNLVEAYFSFPDFSSIHFWNRNFFISDTSAYSVVSMLLLFILCVITFLRNRLITWFYALGTLMLLAFFYYTGLMFSRYIGHLYILFFVCQWLITVNKEVKYTNPILDGISMWGLKWRQPLFYMILIIQFAGGIGAYFMDIKYPFSTSYQAADFIRNHNLMNDEFFGSIDYIISPIAAQTGKKILYGETHNYGSFVKYDLNRNNIESFRMIEPYIEEMYSNKVKHILFIYNQEVFVTYSDSKQPVPWKNALLTNQLNMQLVAHISPGIVEDEQYYLYTIDEVAK